MSGIHFRSGDRPDPEEISADAFERLSLERFGQSGRSDASPITCDQAQAQCDIFFRHERPLHGASIKVCHGSEDRLILTIVYGSFIFAAHQQVAGSDQWKIYETVAGTPTLPLSEVLPQLWNRIAVAVGWSGSGISRD